MLSFQGAQFEKDIILTCVRGYVAYPLSDRQIEELLQARGVSVEHAPINRWVLKDRPQLEAAFQRRQRPVWMSGRRDATSSRVRGHWRSLYRAVDQTGQPLDVLLTEQRAARVALRFLTKARRRHHVPETITIDGREAKATAIQGDNAQDGTAITIRQVRSLKNVVEPDQRAVKRVVRPMLGVKTHETAQRPIAGREFRHRLRQGQMAGGVAQGRTPAEPFSS